VDSPEARAPLDLPWLFGGQGMSVLALVTLVAAAASATDVALIGGCLLAIGLLARGWAAVALARVEYRRRPLATRLFCGETLAIETSLANTKPLPLVWAEVWERLPLALEPDGELEGSPTHAGTAWVRQGAAVWPYRRVRWQRRLACTRRGAYMLSEQWVRVGDPFGLSERQIQASDRTEVVVYPRVVPLRRLGLPLHHPSLDAVSARSPATDPTRTAGLRDYQPDDPLKLIHWPTTARRGSLQVRVLEPATSLRVSLVLDVRGFWLGVYREKLLELAISALASIAVYLHEQGQPVGLLANTDPPLEIRPGASVSQVQQILEALARLQAAPSVPLLPWVLGPLPRGSTAVLATSDVTPNLEMHLETLTDAGCRVLPVLASSGTTRSLGPRWPNVVRLAPDSDLTTVLEGAARDGGEGGSRGAQRPLGNVP
jgi:uncharacterized protein (DUF58 family)